MPLNRKDKAKKRIIALLLLALCLICLAILVFTPEPNIQRMERLSTADSLIKANLHAFNIPEDQIRTQSVRVDSNLSRISYRVTVPPGFSKTQLHVEMNNTFYPYGIGVPARIHFPNRDMQMHLTLNETVIRSISVQVDPELTMRRNMSSILIAFNQIPSRGMLDQIRMFGEPITLLFRITDPLEARDIRSEMNGRYPHLAFWLKNDQGENMLQRTSSEALLPVLRELQETSPGVSLVSFGDYRELQERIPSGLHSLRVINAGGVHTLNAAAGRAPFLQELEKLELQAQSGMHPVAMVSASEEALEWLHETLPEMKKRGLVISAPPLHSEL